MDGYESLKDWAEREWSPEDWRLWWEWTKPTFDEYENLKHQIWLDIMEENGVRPSEVGAWQHDRHCDSEAGG